MKPLPLLALLVATAAACGHPRAGTVAAAPWYPARDGDRPLHGVFEGRVPCLAPERAGCEKTKVALAVYGAPGGGAPRSYRLAHVHVANEPEGARAIVAGSLRLARGTSLDPTAPVYELDAAAPPELRAFWVIGRDILFLLDGDRRPRVGTASWSFCLNRVR